MKRTRWVALAILVSLQLAECAPWPQAPPEVVNMNTLPNAGQLFIQYCLVGRSICVTRKAICYGQCCDQYEADSIGYACSGDIEGVVPWGFKYASWTCQPFNPSDKPPGGAKGKAGRKDPCPKEKNPR